MSQPNQEPCPLCLKYVCEHRQSNKDWQKELEPIFTLLDKCDKYVLDGGYPTGIPSRDLAKAKIQQLLDNQAAEVRELILKHYPEKHNPKRDNLLAHLSKNGGVDE